MREVVIASACRTPIGSFNGALSPLPAPKLGAIVIEEALKRANVPKEMVDEVIMGCVLTAGVGQAPARQAAIFAGLPTKVECMTINKVCGSGLKSVMLATQAIKLGDADIIVAGGMESMSNAPYLLDKARFGYRMGHAQIIDSMIKDGLWDVYNDFHMGNAGELCARECNISREEQDEFAVLSYKRALEAIEKGYFKNEIVPVSVPQPKGEPIIVSEDEEPKKVVFDKIPKLKPAFDPNGTITAANASKINDGAAALVLMSKEKADELGIKPLARIVAYTSAAKDPAWFTTAPVDAIEKVLRKANMKKEDIDLFEVNEAFAVVALATSKLAGIPIEKMNIHGGAVALGHPIGASGARILTTLLYAMERKGAKFGIAAICIGGGEASAVIVERV
ncbi:acetyl-CoA C-acetyltransferase [Candidatus Kryptonium thompsonii]|uniref:acetyl-CoA C-acetyltransferase n=1 Tax=Candidatus Kryptonium thompsonii TaxID=1633631 RepID=A0ABM9UVG7_9BACT|nr:acetyl-CoA C-acetyltransferase [Candidatus Kryptonium thompsoni]CUS81062.1 acetyl-CoA C-acetyltransferase [Candidatus Kryptonium thompsoni]CUS87527.1 acetyl-CoA C-acetyltransferase [Candidatus Kryptonium thompsoni]CUS89638.1 acetyl-CoA C-acetyltransferase [Candidatus Kryptonium thompsoni]CUT00574.1 acetyl-CoA C-acetyltransferase [Candidatus Kryptonium thompsoni]CUT08330.1 acetyl-CoA C-acetyltransferase [Candidatus Kryptonium thompsoni]